MKLSKMPKKQACECMKSLLPWLDELQKCGAIQDAKRATSENDKKLTPAEYIRILAPAALDTDIQDGIVSAMTGIPVDALQDMPLEEYMNTLDEFSMSDVLRFFTWWADVARVV